MTHPLAKLLSPFIKDHPEVTVRQLTVLALLSEAKPKDRTIRALAEAMGINKPSITRAADRLTLEKLAIRRPDPNDKRSVYVEITKAGERVLVKALKSAGVPVPTPAPVGSSPAKSADKSARAVTKVQPAASAAA
jgi:DNA-binding MarR family transcriptional regulator